MSLAQKTKAFLFRNTSARQTVAKNTIWLSVSNFGGRIIKAAVVIYAARVLGAAGWGIFSYAVTLAGFLTLFIDPGINSILMRETAKSSEEEQKKILSTALLNEKANELVGLIEWHFGPCARPIFGRPCRVRSRRTEAR